MSWVIRSLQNFAHLRPAAMAVFDGSRCLTYGDLMGSVARLAQRFREHGCRNIALLADNSPEWIIADLAAWQADATLVPVPPFFTPAQIRHLFATSAIDTVVTLESAAATDLLNEFDTPVEGIDHLRIRQRGAGAEGCESPHEGCCKVTYTSGSTGTPKGVMLSGHTIDAVTRRLVAAFADTHITRHLCSMPLATLLENIAGVYVPLVRGTSVCVPSLAGLGLYGSSRIDVKRFRRTIAATRAESLIVQPQTLRELTASVRQDATLPAMPLRFVAVGGAKVAEADLEAAADAGIPAFQGYGLSECASVVALNRPSDRRSGSVGRPLPGLDVEIAADGEILVGEQCMSGYIGDRQSGHAKVATGDLGYLDDDGYLYVTGRKKDVFITSFGRNVSPEWPEAVLLHEPEVAQACVFGEGMPYNTAVIVPASPCDGADLAAAIVRANHLLPDYARVSEWIVADEAFSPANGELTTTGKPRRDAVARRYLFPADRARTLLPPTARATVDQLQRTSA